MLFGIVNASSTELAFESFTSTLALSAWKSSIKVCFEVSSTKDVLTFYLKTYLECQFDAP